MGRGRSSQDGLSGLATLRRSPGTSSAAALEPRGPKSRHDLTDWSKPREQALLTSYEGRHGTVARADTAQRRPSDNSQPLAQPRRKAERPTNTKRPAWQQKRHDPYGPAVIANGDQMTWEIDGRQLAALNTLTGENKIAKTKNGEKMIEVRGPASRRYIGVLDPETGQRRWFAEDGTERFFFDRHGKLKRPPGKARAVAVSLALSFTAACKTIDRTLATKIDGKERKREVAKSAQNGAAQIEPLQAKANKVKSSEPSSGAIEWISTDDLLQSWETDPDLAEIGLN